MELSKTEYKGFIIHCDPSFPSHKRIFPDGKGSVPKELRGIYTSVPTAQEHIDLVLKKREADAPKGNTASRSKSVRSRADNGSVAA